VITKTKPANKIRFAVLIRVSTEKQKKKGESLRTQKKQIEDAIQFLDGEIAAEYGGQESATTNSEKREVSRMLSDAEKRPALFDAIIVAHPDRWSRDNAFSEIGLNRLQAAGMRFFVLTQEHDLNDPSARMMLAMFTVFGSYQAKLQAKKSQENRIARAERNIPTAGQEPFGRIFNRNTSKWEIDHAKQKMIEEVATRYIAGESLRAMTKEFNCCPSNLTYILREKLGTTWTQTHTLANGEKHKITLTVPPLLSDAMIAKVHRRTQMNRSNSGPIKNKYLLSNFIFCEKCGYALVGQKSTHGGQLFYRHRSRDGAEACTIRPRPFISAQEVEDRVITSLFEDFGNLEGARKAFVRAIPNHKELIAAREKLARWEKQLDELNAKKDRVMNLFQDGDIDRTKKSERLQKLKAEEAEITKQFNAIRRQVDHIPDETQLDTAASEIHAILNKYQTKLVKKSAKVRARMEAYEYMQDISLMTWEEKRSLVERVFDGEELNGRKRGVYVTAHEKKERRRGFAIELHGLLEVETTTGRSVSDNALSCRYATQP
jgi:site-specific DNA recombinase